MASKKTSTDADLIQQALRLFPATIKQKKKAHDKKEKIIKLFLPVIRDFIKSQKKAAASSSSEKKKLHPWRLCPIGEHWVVTHDLKTDVSIKNPDGLTLRRGHCRDNPSKRDILTADEMREISRLHFGSLKDTVSKKKWEFSKRETFDREILGWTTYWNDVLKPKIPLDPDVVKALIGSESSFNLYPKPQKTSGGLSLGLTQILQSTVRILKDTKGELKDHLIQMNEDDMNDPTVAIGAAVRWLHHKKKLASIVRLKREATWREAVAEYKSYLSDMVSMKEPNPKGMDTFDRLLKELKGLK